MSANVYFVPEAWYTSVFRHQIRFPRPRPTRILHIYVSLHNTKEAYQVKSYINGVVANRRDVSNSAFAPRRKNHAMLHQSILVHNAVQVTACNVAAVLNILRMKFPGSGTRERWYVDALRDIDWTRELVDVLQRTLNTVEDAAENAGTQFDGQWLSSAKHGITNRHTACLFIHLNTDIIVWIFLCFQNTRVRITRRFYIPVL